MAPFGAHPRCLVGLFVMDADLVKKINDKGDVVEELILLPDADISDDETDNFQADIFFDTSSDTENHNKNQTNFIKNIKNVLFESFLINKELKKENILDPYSLFSMFFSDKLFELICTETNKYAIEKNSSFRTTVKVQNRSVD